ncbi:zinc ABC transporter substrate-binding protein [Acuticoccus sp.]|uniref:zinc ABC transporter substrate-binding protein n=1 Tax=Acuticoccus sp. TaxID=1904378 RepID=UPI003B51F02E
MKPHLLATALVSAVAAPALAAPQVAVDILPVHSLVSRVMEGVGEPTLVVPPGASPHGYAMRPSEAAAMQDADIVFWIGEELSPAFARTIGSLAGDAQTVALLELPNTIRLESRGGATFEADDHGDGLGPGDDAADADDDHEDAAAHDDHGHDDAHAHHGVDPHAWLDPENAKIWVDAIAAALSQVDPDNASTYYGNAASAKGELDTLIAEVSETVEPVRGQSFVVFHDAYHYFEARFDVEATGAISLGDAAQPSPARIAEVKAIIADTDAACVFSEPQFEPRLVDAVIEGTDASKGALDPLGADIRPGPDFYPTLIRTIADNLAGCLRPAS